MALTELLLLIVAVVNFLLAVLIYFRNKKNPVNIFFGLTTLGVSLWAIGILGFRIDKIFRVDFWSQFTYLSASLLFMSLLYFSFVFPGGKVDRRVAIFLVLLNIITIIICLIPRFIISEVYIDNGVREARLGLGYYLYSGFTLFYFIYAYVNLIKKYFKSSGIARNQLRYLFIGTVLSTVVGIFTNSFLFFFTAKYNWLGPSGTFIMIIFIAYAMSRYRFLDIRLVIFRSITFGFLVFLITVLFATISGLVAFVFENLTGSSSNVISGLVVGILVSISYQPIRGFIEGVTNKVLYKKGYDADKLIDKISETSSSTLNLNQLINSVSVALTDSLNPSKFSVVLLDDKGDLQVTHKDGFNGELNDFIKGKENFLSVYFKKDKDIKVIDELKAKYDSGEYIPKNPKLLESLYSLGVSLIIPLYTKDNLIGVIAVGSKKSGDPYNQQDLNVLSITSKQVAVAIENARLYEEQKNFAVTLSKEVDRATKELRQANDQLKEMDQMKSDFISIASHQLRTPLTVIKGYVSMMQEGSFGEVPKKIIDQLGKIRIANERLIDLVENLLDISRIESGRQQYNFERKNVVELAGMVVDNLKMNAKSRGLRLIFHKPKKEVPEVLIDQKLHEVMMNFVDNAIKYTKKGKVEVFVTPEPKGMVTFSVKDTGAGITKETMAHLFEKFSRAKGSFQMHTEGLGLGLFVAKMLVDRHNGIIGAESAGKDKGSRFFIQIPIDGPEAKGFKSGPPQLKFIEK